MYRCIFDFDFHYKIKIFSFSSLRLMVGAKDTLVRTLASSTCGLKQLGTVRTADYRGAIQHPSQWTMDEHSPTLSMRLVLVEFQWRMHFLRFSFYELYRAVPGIETETPILLAENKQLIGRSLKL